MASAIIDRGRGPEIAGTRITVYDILYEMEEGMVPAEIAELFMITQQEVQTALQYIRDHEEEVRKDYAEIMRRIDQGNPPELQARIEATHAKYVPLWEEMRRRHAQENGDARNPGRHQHPGAPEDAGSFP